MNFFDAIISWLMWRVCSQNCVAKDQQQLSAFSGVDRFMHCVDPSEALQERRQRSPPLFTFVSVYPPDGSYSTSSSLSPSSSSSSSNSSEKESHLVWSSCGYCHRNNQHSASSTRRPWTASDEGERCRSNRSGTCWDHLADRRRRIRFSLYLSHSLSLTIYLSITRAPSPAMSTSSSMN